MQKNLRQTFKQIISTGFSDRKIARLSGYSRNSIARYRLLAASHELSIEKIDEMDDQQLSNICIRPKRYETNFRVPDWNYVEKCLKAKHQTRVQLWEEYCLAEPQTAYSYSQFNALLREHMNKHDLTMRLIHYAGEAVQVDYAGKRPHWKDPKTGEKHYVELFVGVLSCSNYIFAWASPTQKVEDWVEGTIRMLEFFKGVPQEIICDNLKAAVIKPGMIPEINRAYLDLADHYGFAINPARVKAAQDKAKGENAVLQVTRRITVILNRRDFFSIEEINEAIIPLLERLNNRPFKGLPGNRTEHYLELDLPLLNDLPDKRFEFGSWVSSQKLGRTYHINYKNCFYSVPHTLVGERLEIRIARKTIEVFHLGKRVTSHILLDREGQWSTNKDHMPANHKSYSNRSYSYYLKWAETVGRYTMDTVKNAFAGQHEASPTACKACDRLQKLARDYSAENLEAACNKAFVMNSPRVTTIHNILKRKTYSIIDPNPDPIQPQLPLHSNIRGASYFANEENRDA